MGVGVYKRHIYNYKVYILVSFSATNYQYTMSQIAQLVSEKEKNASSWILHRIFFMKEKS